MIVLVMRKLASLHQLVNSADFVVIIICHHDLFALRYVGTFFVFFKEKREKVRCERYCCEL